jgi:hypothetical protein
MDAVRQLAAQRRLDRAKVELARAADALERFNKEQRGDSWPITPDTHTEDEPATVSGSNSLLLPTAPAPPPVRGCTGPHWQSLFCQIVLHSPFGVSQNRRKSLTTPSLAPLQLLTSLALHVCCCCCLISFSSWLGTHAACRRLAGGAAALPSTSG